MMKGFECTRQEEGTSVSYHCHRTPPSFAQQRPISIHFRTTINCQQVNAPICDQNVQAKYMALIAAYWGHYTPPYVHFL